MNVSAEAILLAIIAIIPGMWAAIKQIRKDRVEQKDIENQIMDRILKRSDSELARAYTKLEELAKRVEFLEQENETEKHVRRETEIRLEKAEKRNAQYLNGIYILTRQIAERGEVPSWKPADTGPLPVA